MKTLLILLLLTVGFSALAQRSSSKYVTTDGRQLRIRVDIEQTERSIHYRRSFDVTNMDDKAVKALENHIIDSLDRASSDGSLTVAAEPSRSSWHRKKEEESIVYTSDPNVQSVRLEAHASSSLSPSDVAPSSVLVKEDKENGRLWMQYTFQKDGEELVIERTANVVGKSEREKQAIIRDTERSFGIKTGNQ
ncbi:hypothetical protein [Spirosoma sp.]|uniref:hypothetical protein n=1 Tax=Spirosoma sp. TaxID=1899569 RepID=UPI00262C3811|nr:hypothetical protein [Spirosoma sp.]MCX6214273.1 hypothetical protein [Spirosoma sp.]